jgi:hypothetical protein
MRAEGWYLDPFGVHAQRWFSDGRPTGLVRDGAAESQDDPPADEYSGVLTAAPEGESDSSDLKRADDVIRDSTAVTRSQMIDAAIRVGLNPWDGPL